MENRDKDKKTSDVSKSSGGNSNPSQGQKQSDVDFGKNIGRPEHGNEPGRSDSSDLGETGRSSSSGNRSQSGSMGSSESDRRPSGGSEQ